MKHIVIVAALVVLLCPPATAQEDERRLSFSGEVGIGVPFNTPKTMPVLLRASAYYNAGCRWELGVGSGVSFYDGETLIPLLVEVRFGFTRPRTFTPYLACAAGYSFAPKSGTEGGLLLSPAVGVKWKLRPRLKAHLAVGYELQKLTRLKSYSDPYFDYGFREELSHSSLTISVGITF